MIRKSVAISMLALAVSVTLRLSFDEVAWDMGLRRKWSRR
jgi:hypothetical protein